MSEHSPFHCGSQYADWEEANCCHCKKGKCGPNDTTDDMDCDIQRRLSEACFDGGMVNEDIAERMGLLDNIPPRQAGFSYIWRCKEWEAANAQA